MANYHARGEKDGRRNRYNAPHGGIIRETFGLWNEKERADRKTYSAGWKNARKQK